MLKELLLELGLDPKAALAAFAGAACSIFFLRNITPATACGSFTVGFFSAQYLIEYAPMFGLQPTKGLIYILALTGMLICQGIIEVVTYLVRTQVAARTKGAGNGQ